MPVGTVPAGSVAVIVMSRSIEQASPADMPRPPRRPSDPGPVLAALRRRAARLAIPVTATWELTHRCPLDCRHCYLQGSREVDARVDAHCLGRILQHEVGDPALGGARQLYHIRKVDLALFRAGRDPGEVFPEEAGIVDVDAGVEFADTQLLRRRFGFLDHADDVTTVVAQNPTESL